MRDRCSSASADDEDAHSAVHPEHRVCFFVMCYQAGTAQRKSSHLIHDPPFVRLMVSLPLSCILSCFSIASASVARPRR